MLFNSSTFAVFFAAVFVLYWLLARRVGVRLWLLLMASYVFYAHWSFHYLGLILFSTAIDYLVGRGLGRAQSPARRRALLVVSLTANLGLLAFFKYWDFFALEASAALSAVGLEVDPWVLHLVLPVGISFYTFQTLSYTIDVYRREIEPEPSFLRFALFVSFFPQLVAGPIVRARDFLPQLRLPPRLGSEAFESGLTLIFWGLLKKVVIADYLGRELVDPLYGVPEMYGGWYSVLALYGFAFQVYGDFSGYSDCAIGTARLLGFQLPINFNAPFRATSVRDHWRRWHISLSTWLRDYVFISLGGSRGARWMVYRNLMITMVLSGLWHRATWPMILFGFFHGALLCLERLFRLPDPPPEQRLRTFLGRLWAFHAVILTYPFFRAPDLDVVGRVFASLARPTPDLALSPYVYVALAVAVVTHFLPRWRKDELLRRFYAVPAPAKGLAYALAVGLLMNATAFQTPFIYFQF